jgi:hypothetical protein
MVQETPPQINYFNHCKYWECQITRELLFAPFSTQLSAPWLANIQGAWMPSL